LVAGDDTQRDENEEQVDPGYEMGLEHGRDRLEGLDFHTYS
jgi:hypothetical protein